MDKQMDNLIQFESTLNRISNIYLRRHEIYPQHIDFFV